MIAFVRVGRGQNKLYLKKVASKIKKLRQQHGVTQEVFYFDTNIHIGRIETGKSNLTLGTLIEICDYFGISINDFFEDVK